MRSNLNLLGSIALLACFVVACGSASAQSTAKPALRGAAGPAPKPLHARNVAQAAPAPQYVAPQPAPQYAGPQAAGYVQPAPGAYGAQLYGAPTSEPLSGAALFAGCYVGVHGSGMSNRVTSKELHPDYAAVPQQKFTMNSVGAGVQLGCNFVQQDMVFGVEAEGMFPISSRGEATYMQFGNTMETNLLNAKEQATYGVSLRGGIVADRTLFYAKLGFAQTSMKLDQKYEVGTFVNKTAFTNYTTLSTSGEFSKISYVFGGGAEYAIDANWSVKGEYNLIVTQKDDLVANQTGAGFTRITTGATATGSGTVDDTPITGASRVKTVSNMRNVFKLGVNRRF
jgi:opacity protein-like surface antigen